MKEKKKEKKRKYRALGINVKVTATLHLNEDKEVLCYGYLSRCQQVRNNFVVLLC